MEALTEVSGRWGQWELSVGREERAVERSCGQGAPLPGMLSLSPVLSSVRARHKARLLHPSESPGNGLLQPPRQLDRN